MRVAGNVRFPVDDVKVDEFKRLMNTEILPMLKTEKGFRQAPVVLGSNAASERAERKAAS